VPHQLPVFKAFIQEGFHHKVRGAKQRIHKPVLFFLFAQLVGVIGMFVIGRQTYSGPLAPLRYHLPGKPRIGIGPFQYGGDPQASGCLEHLEHSQGPSVDDINLSD
jgi:hypothetical protein